MENSPLQGLYAITDEQLMPENIFSQKAEQALAGGTRIIQYRDKSNNLQKRFQQASLLCKLGEKYQAICLINDDVELAKAVNAQGVHLGRDDISLTQARQTLGENAIIGISCYNDLNLAIAAEKATASYVAFGAIFPSPTKPNAIVAGLNIILKAKQQLAIPICSIGGITDDNIHQVIQNGSDMVAVISSLFSSQNIPHSAKKLSNHFINQ